MAQQSGPSDYPTSPPHPHLSECGLTPPASPVDVYENVVLPTSAEVNSAAPSPTYVHDPSTIKLPSPEDASGSSPDTSKNARESLGPQNPNASAPRQRSKSRSSSTPPVTDASPPLQEDLAREHLISESIERAQQERSPWRDYLRTIREILSITPGVWAKRLALTALGAVSVATSTFTFSQSIALIGESSNLDTATALESLAISVFTYFATSVALWYVAYFAQYKNDLLTGRQANDVDLAIDRSIKEVAGRLPEEMRQREGVAELCSLVERHQESSKKLVGGIINLSQECVELAVTSAAIIWSGGGLGILPIMLGGYLKYRSAQRISDRKVRSEELAAELELLYEDGDRTLSTNSSISILQIAQSHSRVVDRVMNWKAAAAQIHLDALKRNERDELITNKILEIPVAGSCLYFMSQWLSGELSPALCIWVVMSVWSLRENINQIGTLLSAQSTDLELASYRHTLVDIARNLGDERERTLLTEAPSIRFEGVRLRRPGSTRDTLKRSSFEIPAGSCVGILGNNGQGKSSLVALILGRVLPTSGDVFVGEHNTRERAILTGALNQDFNLVPGLSVRENIELFRPSDGGMSADEAVELLGIGDTLFENKPAGLDTIVPGKNQKGTNFSGGQVQLIALARAIAAESRLLVLDEPLSALSPAVQARIHAALFTLNPRPTLILVTHKIEQAHSCDSVMIIERGEIVEQGRPEELLRKSKSKFMELYRAQKQMAGRKKYPKQANI